MPEIRNDYHQRCLDLIETHGWMAQAVFPGEDDPDDVPSFTYTVGAFKNFELPELIIFSLPKDVRHSLLTMYVESGKSGTSTETNRRLSGWLDNYEIVLIDIEDIKSMEYFGSAVWFNDTPDFPARQLIWPTTKTHAYPWDDTWPETEAWRQPVLGNVPPSLLLTSSSNGSAVNDEL